MTDRELVIKALATLARVSWDLSEGLGNGDSERGVVVRAMDAVGRMGAEVERLRGIEAAARALEPEIANFETGECVEDLQEAWLVDGAYDALRRALA